MLKKLLSFFLWVILLNQSAWAESISDFAQIVRENADAVVAVSASQTQAGIEIPVEPQQGNPSLGSGFIISDDGYILTNYHVVKDARQIMVKFKDSHILEATLIGSDKVTDVSLLKVNASGLQKVKIGSVTALEVGEWVLAIGAPFGFEQSVTKGIVSAKNRMVSKEVYVPFIQTDVAINQGNSGGPLFNTQGQVVGVNAWIYSKTGGYEGLSFAIPIDIAMNTVTQLKNKGKVSRGWLGVISVDVPISLAQSFAMPRAYGALIEKIALLSPAQKAGLQVGDIVVSFNGMSVENSAELPTKVGMMAAGTRVNLEVIRQGEIKVVEVVVAPSPEN
jgi:serine protease Do